MANCYGIFCLFSNMCIIPKSNRATSITIYPRTNSNSNRTIRTFFSKCPLANRYCTIRLSSSINYNNVVIIRIISRIIFFFYEISLHTTNTYR